MTHLSEGSPVIEDGRGQKGFTLVELTMTIAIVGVILVPVIAWSMLAFSRGQESEVTGGLAAERLSRLVKADVAGSSFGQNLDPLLARTCTPAPQAPTGDPAVTVLWLVSADRTQLTTYVAVPRFSGTSAMVDPESRAKVFRLVRRTCDWTPDPSQPKALAAGTAGPLIDEVEVAEYLHRTDPPPVPTSSTTLAPGSSTTLPDPSTTLVTTTTTPASDTSTALGDGAKVMCKPRIGNNESNDGCGEVGFTINRGEGPLTINASRRIDPPVEYSLTRKPLAVIKCTPACPAEGNRRFQVLFSGVDSFDPDADVNTDLIQWDFGDGTTASGTLSPPPHVYSDLGNATSKTFTVTLTITNRVTLFSGIATTTVTVHNTRPVPSSNPNSVDGNRVDPVRFDGTGSWDPDADTRTPELTYLWDFGPATGPGSITLTGGAVNNDPAHPGRWTSRSGIVTVTYRSLGSFTAKLTVTDADGQASTLDIPVSIKNKPPVACFETLVTGVVRDGQAQPPPSQPSPQSQNCPTTGIPPAAREILTDADSITIDLTSKSRDDDCITTCPPAIQVWTKYSTTDGVVPLGTGTRPTPHTFAKGEHTVTLEVIDEDGARSSYSVHISVNEKPQALFSTSPAPCFFNAPAGQCVFDGSASYDPDGRVDAYHWDFGDGTVYDSTSRTDSSVTHAFPGYGTYMVQLTVTDNLGAEGKSVKYRAKLNEAPTARFNVDTANLAAFRKKDFQFRGSDSLDDQTARLAGRLADGTITAWEWDFDYTAPNFTVDSTVQNPVHRYPTTGNKTVALRVKDDDNVWSTIVTRPISVSNQLPVAVITKLTNDTQQGMQGTFSGAESYDPDAETGAPNNGIVTFNWTFIEPGQPNVTATGVTATHTWSTYGAKRVRLQVVDADNESVTTQYDLYANSLPNADFSVVGHDWGWFTVDLPGKVRMDGSASWDEDGDLPLKYFWSFRSPIDPYSTGTDPIGEVDYDQDVHRGVQFVTLIVEDARGGRSAAATKTVVTINELPSAFVTASPCPAGATGSVGCVFNGAPGTIQFRGETSFDPDKDNGASNNGIKTYEWNFGNGQTSSAKNPTATYASASPNTYTVKLKVYDKWDSSSEYTFFVRVNRAPTANITASRNGSNVGGSGSSTLQLGRNLAYDLSSNAVDPDGGEQPPPRSGMTYLWNFGDGTATSTLANPQHVWSGLRDSTNPYQMTVTVTDGDGRSFTAQRNVTTTNVPPVAAFSMNNDAITGLLKCNTQTVPCGDVPLPDYSEYTSPNFAVNFNALHPGSPSSDVDGTIDTYEWTFLKGTNVVGTRSGPSVSFPFDSFGTFTVRLTVTDNNSAGTTLSKSVKVNKRPIVTVTPSSQISFAATTSQQVTFTAAATDPDGSALAESAFTWQQGVVNTDGSHAPTLSLNNPGGRVKTFTFAPGSYRQEWDVQSLVRDSDGGTGIMRLNNIVKLNKTPVAKITAPTLSSGQAIKSVAPYTFAFNALASPATNGSYDSDGTVASYHWDFGDGTTSADYPLEPTTAPNKTYANPGSYTVVLTVTDNQGATSTDTRTVRANRPPTAVVGPATLATLAPKVGWNFTFDGTGSSDQDGTIPNTTAVGASAGYLWTFQGNPTINVDNPSKPVVKWSTAGSYLVRLLVRDVDLAWSVADEKTVVVTPNVNPTASFVTNPANGFGYASTFTVGFDGTGSTDPDGAIVKWEWNFGDGSPTATGATVSHDYTTYPVAPQRYFTATLTVTDHAGQIATTTRLIRHDKVPTIVVATSPSSATLTAPNADCDADPGLDCWEFVFDASGSSDPDGTIQNVTWNFQDPNDPTPATGYVVRHKFTERGTYPVVLTMTDDEGGVATRPINVKVNRPPIACPTSPAQVSQECTDPPGTASAPRLTFVTFNGDASRDPDGTVAQWDWDFGDGQTASGRTVTHRFFTLGTFTVTLTVTDDDGATDTRTMPVTVTNQAPTVKVTTNPSPPVGGPGLQVTFDSGGSTDADGTIVKWEWDFDHDGAKATGDAASPLPVVTHTFPSDPLTAYRSYLVTLTLTDNNGEKSTLPVTVKINRPPTGQIVVSGDPVRSKQYQFGWSASDSDGTVQSLEWQFEEGGATRVGTPATMPAQVPFTFYERGPKLIKLIITDNNGTTHTAETTVNVVNRVPENVTLTAQAGTTTPGSLSGSTPLLINFTASASDLDNQWDGNAVVVAKYEFDWTNNGNGPFEEVAACAGLASCNVAHTYPTQGTFRPVVRVTDTDLGTAKSTSLVVNVGARTGPTASFTATPSSGNAPLTVAFDGSGSTDSGGRIDAYDWDFGDGTTGTGATTSHNYGPGHWTARLTVRDNSGDTDTTTRTIVVAGQLPAPPQAPNYTGNDGYDGIFDYDTVSSWSIEPVPGATSYIVFFEYLGSGHGFCSGSYRTSRSFTVTSPTFNTTVCYQGQYRVSYTAEHPGSPGSPASPGRTVGF